MTSANELYDIRERTDLDGLCLELFVEEKRIARAGASADILDAIEQQLGFDRQDIFNNLSQALADNLKNQLDKVTVTEPTEDPGHPLRFWAKYTFRNHQDTGHDHQYNIGTGLVWYDVNTSITGPEGLSVIVRNKMRLEVHRKLTGHGSSARALVDIHG